MLPLEIVFNLALFGLDAATLALARKRPSLTSGAIAGWCLGAFFVALVLATAIPFMRAFFVARLLAYAIFLHGPLCWLGLAWVLRSQSRAPEDESERTSPWAARVAAAFGLLLAGVGVDAFLLEPYWLQVRRVEVRSARVTTPLKIVVLADLQTDAIGDYERDVFREIAAQQPDLLLLAGDYLQCWNTESTLREAKALQAALHQAGVQPRLGAFAVGGDCEGRGWEAIFEGTCVQPLSGVAQINSEVRVQGLTLGESYRGAPALPDTTQFRIVLGHRPGYALEPAAADLLLAGHTHGGQVQLPGIGPLVTLSRVPREWAGGTPTKLASGATLVVSRGVGMERVTAPRLRFLCRPELVVIEVLPLGADPRR